MKPQTATTIEQSQRLIACGVNPKSADMCYIFFSQYGEQMSHDEWIECDEAVDRGESYLIPIDFGMYDHSYSDNCPAWSLSALLALLPRTITHKGRTNIFGLYHEEEKDGGQWNCSCPGTVFFLEDTPFDAIIKMIEWLTANGYTLNPK